MSYSKELSTNLLRACVASCRNTTVSRRIRAARNHHRDPKRNCPRAQDTIGCVHVQNISVCTHASRDWVARGRVAKATRFPPRE